MKAVLCKSLEGPDGLTLEELPSPIPGHGQVAVKIEAVSLNFFDTLICRGAYQHKPSLPFSPGGEAAGYVIGLGADVGDLKVGDRIFFHAGVNCAREELSIDASSAIPIPPGLKSELAAVLPIAHGTALHALEDRGRLKAGETLLVLGATGGTGLAAVELGHKMGARVIAAGTCDEKLKLCAEHGATDLLNLTHVDLKNALRNLTNGNGVDVVYDCIGGPYAEPAVRAMAWAGRYLVIGFAAGDIPKIPLNLLLLKGCELVGVFLGRHASLYPAAFADQLKRLAHWAAAGEIRPYIDHVFPLAETANGLRALEARQIKGKIVIMP